MSQSNKKKEETAQPVPKTNQLLYLAALGLGSVVVALQHAQYLTGETKKTQQDLIFYTRCQSALSFVWLGMVLAISFMEAWVKFKAASLTREIGLDVGRTVFAALNRVEIVWSVLSFLLLQQLSYCHLHTRTYHPADLLVASFIPFILIAIQTLYLQPYLDNRARIIIRKEVPPKNAIHLIYVLFEVLKVVALAYTGLKGLFN